MGLGWEMLVTGAAVGAGLFFGLENVGGGFKERLKNIGFEEKDIELGTLKIRKVRKNDSPPSPPTIGWMNGKGGVDGMQMTRL